MGGFGALAPGCRSEPAASLQSQFVPARAAGFTLLLWGTGHSDSQVNDLLERARQIGATHIQIPITECQRGLRDTEVGSCVLGATPGTWEDAQRYARLAQQKGLTFAFLPIVGTPAWEWRGQFDPSDPARWFTTYTQWMTKVARASRELGASELIAGTEFGPIYRYEQPWRDLIRKLRTEFKGPVVLTANWGNTDLSFWDAVDAIGVSAYYALSHQADPSQSVLDSAWLALKDRLLALSRHWNRPLHFTEIGYPSNALAASEPWQAVENQAPHWELQERCLRAFARAWAPQGVVDGSVARTVVWAIEDLSEKRYPVGFNPLGKPAEHLLRDFFKTF